jgi:hypothetical protein
MRGARVARARVSVNFLETSANIIREYSFDMHVKCTFSEPSRVQRGVLLSE